MAVEKTECPACGRDDFATEQGMKQHHAKSHGESISGVLVECHNCGANLRKKRHRVRESERHFCSPKCRGDYDKSHRDPKNHPWRSKSKLKELYLEDKMSSTQIANQFGVEPETIREWLVRHDIPRRDGGPNPKYPKLRDPDWLEEQYHGKLKDTTEIADELGCSSGGVLYQLHKNDISIRHGGDPDREDNYGEGWGEQKRQEIRRRDGYECQACELSNNESKEKYGMALDVHHITPASAFDNPKLRNDPSNLITLCRPCHIRWEQMAPLRPDVAAD